MHDPSRILIVDDHETNRDILATRLATQGYDLCQATDGQEALDAAKTLLPDLILLDVMMPKLNGIEVCRRLKGDAALPFMSIILVTAKTDTKDVVAGLDAGADEYLTKPVDQAALAARVRSTLRLKALHDRVLAQAADLAKQAADLANWNQTLEQRVAEQVSEIERIGRLKRFLPPQIAKLVASSHDESMLESHRRAVTVLFCDLRGFTTFSETSEPEEVMLVLREYHTALGVLVDKFEGTVERFVGDGLLVIFNDPLPCEDAGQQAVQMAVAMRGRVAQLGEEWTRRGYRLGLGVGISQGHATIGQIGFEGRSDYTAIGSVTNLAARLCGEAEPGQILISQRVYAAAEDIVIADPVGELALRGFLQPARAYNVVGLDEARAGV